jgi:hypothetical protein
VRCARLWVVNTRRGRSLLARAVQRGWVDGWLTNRYLAQIGYGINRL